MGIVVKQYNFLLKSMIYNTYMPNLGFSLYTCIKKTNKKNKK